MTRAFPHFPRPRLIVCLTLALGLGLFFWPARAVRSDNFVLYFPKAHHVLPLETVEHTKYLPLVAVLNLVGKVGGLQEKRNSLKIWFGNIQLEVRQNEKKVRIDKVWLPISDQVRVSNGQWIVPVDFLITVLPRLTHQVVEYQMGTNRIFIGDVKPSAFSVRLDQLSNGTRLTFQFTDKVTVRTAASNGKWVMFLGDRPVEPLEPLYQFKDPYVSELRFDDQDGEPKLILTPGGSGLNFYPVLAEGGKVLLADVLKPPPTAPEQNQPPQPPATTAPLQPTPRPPVTEEVPAAPPGPPLPAVVLDAGHGGDEAGARSRDGVFEKDLVAQLVARVRLALLATKKYRIVLTRVGDVNPPFEQREFAANLARAVVFLTFHAGNLGGGTPRVVVYSYQPPSPPAAPGQEPPRQLFIPWAQVQQTRLDQSRRLAQVLQQQFGLIPGIIADQPWQAPVRSLRSADAPAVAIEIGSLTPDADSGALTNTVFQQQVSAAIVQALEAFRKTES